ncbi:hypothetical protein GCK32_005205 [Trichostrongylus colubriformis]|uniref:Uncharacterized protein n=1 Tax=Trichostrongylus colubriformis TaxID=6319 RepID=A0AAN8FKD5_TRICO
MVSEFATTVLCWTARNFFAPISIFFAIQSLGKCCCKKRAPDRKEAGSSAPSKKTTIFGMERWADKKIFCVDRDERQQNTFEYLKPRGKSQEVKTAKECKDEKDGNVQNMDQANG